jgi:hypothetical protein
MRHSTIDRGHPSARRAMPLLFALALGVVLGLLGMHTFSADPLGHGPSGPSHAIGASVGGSPGAGAHTSGAEVGTGETPAAHHAPPSHSAMVMTCVLALLAGLLLAGRPAPALLRAPRTRSVARGRASISRAAPRRPPSHIALCISRT